MKIATWNVNGIRARKAEFVAWVAAEEPAVVCLQEIKASPAQVAETVAELTDLPAYINYWHGQKGYSGVSVHVRRDVLAGATPRFSHPSFDRETRIAVVHLRELRIASVYVPNGGKDYPAKLEFLKELGTFARECRSAGTRLILCGDMNVARVDRDVHPSQRKPGVIGQREDERRLFEKVLSEGDLVDVLREQNPEDDRLFTWWPYWREARPRNIGWRIDYIVASTALRCLETRVAREVGTSDHAPVVATFDG